MNFLSHFYFDRYTADPDLVLGTVLPDLVKNARKDWHLHPQKHEEDFQHSEKMCAILSGWKRHLEVDLYFHSSAFFAGQTKTIRLLIAPILQNSPVRPSFLAHISLEIMLDSILLSKNIVNPDDFYEQLKKSDRSSLTQFLNLSMLDDCPRFFQFFDKFIEVSYLHKYREGSDMVYALNRICMRLWQDPLNETQKLQLAAILSDYKEYLETIFMTIFDDIESRLN